MVIVWIFTIRNVTATHMHPPTHTHTHTHTPQPTLSHYFIRLLAEKGLLLRNFTQVHVYTVVQFISPVYQSSYSSHIISSLS